MIFTQPGRSMYKAIHSQTGEEIVILSPAWLRRIEALRAMDHEDLLVCQGCRQPLRVKAGDVKRPHFAHKHLQACSYGVESPEILNARAVLYDWLYERFGRAATVEKVIPEINLPRPIDCWVEMGAESIAFWIIEAGIKLEPRETIKAAFTSLGSRVHYVFLYSMLNEEKKEFHSLLLTPTERAFLRTTAYDEIRAGAGEAGGSLHYLDAERLVLTTYRSLSLFHRPNWYKGVKKSAGLDVITASRLDGGFVYPGETERLEAFQKKQRRLEQKRQRYQARETEWSQRLAIQPPQPLQEGWGAGRSAVEDEDQGNPPLACVTCGQVTTNYWSTFFDASGRKLCRCRECLDRENTENQGA